MPGGGELSYAQGMAAVHETSHWMGLLHTFEGDSCTSDGDFIADTPQQSVSTDQYPRSPAKDTYPDQPRLDPIYNYMDYSTDECYEGFMPMQHQRMMEMWAMHRAGHVAA
ncbi:hypothetical protein P152DRAFT_472231 [Eremomyces bilateralis CBS 781.70]|uniref:Peptidase M43 pregnancy-associated plasma-A domain-containing protein n=1 Tax=Eremomyces bilateralis CBS 781.70 TaxID=1392243 RepID=A0A6G1G993_9PEZI|nr:uncharacterized protein P152DRAFT_472231 [Eremomyces bilateralis CBS 781.70]KAF1814471.1 hypothetical protein P152DRAFT_472231 [Eremomyces bilateralis CBS 781.70]